MGISWNDEVDVVIVGYGMSGAVAAIEAHDAGAKVLILEKGEYPGGLSMLTGGAVTCAANVEATIEYLTQTSGGRVDASLIRTFAQGLVGVEQYIRKLAEVSNARVAIEKMPYMGVPVYPFAGRDTFDSEGPVFIGGSAVYLALTRGVAIVDGPGHIPANLDQRPLHRPSTAQHLSCNRAWFRSRRRGQEERT